MQLTKCCPCPTSSICTQDLAPVDRFSISYDSYIPAPFFKNRSQFCHVTSINNMLFFVFPEPSSIYTSWHPFQKANGNLAARKMPSTKDPPIHPPPGGSPTLQQPSKRGYFPSFGLLGSTKTIGEMDGFRWLGKFRMVKNLFGNSRK